MPSKSAQTALRDILHHIELATGFASGFTPTAFKKDLRTVYAVTRCLEIISEASRRLPDDMKARHPGIAWKQMAGAGNVYRHDYEDVAAEFVWETVQRALPPLKVVIESELDRWPSASRRSESRQRDRPW
jgi:uncharacterized protein with HEPN domain